MLKENSVQTSCISSPHRLGEGQPGRWDPSYFAFTLLAKRTVSSPQGPALSPGSCPRCEDVAPGPGQGTALCGPDPHTGHWDSPFSRVLAAAAQVSVARSLARVWGG